MSGSFYTDLRFRLLTVIATTVFSFAGVAQAGFCHLAKGELRSVSKKQIKVALKGGKVKSYDASAMSAKALKALNGKTGTQVKLCIPMKRLKVAFR